MTEDAIVRILTPFIRVFAWTKVHIVEGGQFELWSIQLRIWRIRADCLRMKLILKWKYGVKV